MSRRAFLRFCGVMTATLALPVSYRTQIAEALSSVRRPVLIWRQFQDCAGNSESLLRSPHLARTRPDPGSRAEPPPPPRFSASSAARSEPGPCLRLRP